MIRFKEFLREGNSNSNNLIKEFYSHVRSPINQHIFGHAKVSLSPIDNNSIELEHLHVHKDFREKGIGTKIIKGLGVLADKHGVDIHLKPDAAEGTDLSVLNKFYGKHGYSPSTQKGWLIRSTKRK